MLSNNCNRDACKQLEPRREKTCLRGLANNTDADQPAHSRRLISVIVIRFLESMLSKLATSEISIFYLVYVAGQTGLSLTLSETLTTGFAATRPTWYVTPVVDERDLGAHFTFNS